MKTKESYNVFRDRVYSYILKYKHEKITKVKGTFKGVESDYMLPDEFITGEYPPMLYELIIPVIKEIQGSKFKYKPHIFSNVILPVPKQPVSIFSFRYKKVHMPMTF